MEEVSSRCVYEACDQFHDAMTRFFTTSKKTHSGKKWNLPTLKQKFRDDAFVFSHHTQFSAVGKRLKIQRLAGTIRMREKIRFSGAVYAVGIRYSAGKWYATFRVKTLEARQSQDSTREPSVGVDFGLKSLAVLSTGEVIANPKPLRCQLRLLQRRQRQLSRKQSGSHRHALARRKVARLHKKITDIRSQSQHLLTKNLVTRFNRIVIEDLDVSGMLKTKKIARGIGDVGFGEIRRQLEYKSKVYGVELVISDRFFPSSKTCSNCGTVRERGLGLDERTFVCQHCGLILCRDLNAARNLNQFGGHRLGGLLNRAQESAKADADGANKALSNCRN